MESIEQFLQDGDYDEATPEDMRDFIVPDDAGDDLNEDSVGAASLEAPMRKTLLNRELSDYGYDLDGNDLFAVSKAKD